MSGLRLWVVEMKFEGEDHWEPTVGVSLTRDIGRDELKRWKERNPDDKFRLSPYRPAYDRF